LTHLLVSSVATSVGFEALDAVDAVEEPVGAADDDEVTTGDVESAAGDFELFELLEQPATSRTTVAPAAAIQR
jgi:hypothetical protein